MPAILRPTALSFVLKRLGGVVASAALLSFGVQAAELGKLSVLSALGQPLQVEIELQNVSSSEASSLVARLASAEAFRLARISLTPTLSSLRFQIEENEGRRFIRITTTQPVSESFVDILLELNSTRGAQVREYTVLLDPAELKQVQSPQVSAPESVRPETTTPIPPVVAMPQNSAAPLAPSTAQMAAARLAAEKTVKTNPAASLAQKNASYRVKKGDTLSRIATLQKPADVSLDMMLLSLYRANPEAFIGKNMNNLISGKILALPDVALVRATDPDDARTMVVAQAVDFSAYRNKLAAQVALSAPTKQAQASQSAAGTISAKVKEPVTAANVAPDKLKLSKANSADKTSLVGVEDKIAVTEQDAQAAARIKELEKNVGDIEKLMVLKNQVLVSAPPVAAEPSAPLSLTLLALAKQHIRALGLVLAGLLVLALLVARRMKKPTPERPVLSEPSMPELASFDSPLDDRAKLAALLRAPLDTDLSDPIAEADAFLAQGFPAKAEAVLQAALIDQPVRNPVLLRLLDLYAARQDTVAFQGVASQLHSITNGEGGEWLQAAMLGFSIDRHNPLYQASATDFMDAPVPVQAPPAVSVVNLSKPRQTIILPPVPIAALAKTLGQAAAVATGRYLKTTSGPLPLTPIALEVHAGLAAAQVAQPEPAQQVETLAKPLLKPLDVAALAPSIVPDAINPAAQFDLSRINLELKPLLAKAVPAQPGAADMSTKLNLATAYQEIGDQEGALELLDEVIQGGSPEQAAKASVMRALLA